MLWDHRPGQNRFAGIVMQEYSRAEQRLIGERRVIFSGTPLGLTEGPHLYKRGGYYHLFTAEGGTGWGHAVTMARARTIDGPYELHPDVHVLSARHRPDVALQRAGHADLVDTPDGRPTWCICAGGRCPTGVDARSDGRRRFRRWSGAKTDGCGPSPAMASGGGNERRAVLRARATIRRPARTSTARSCRLISSGCDRRGPTSCSA